MLRRLAATLPLVAGLVFAIGCGDNERSLPTDSSDLQPSFLVTPGASCDQSLVKKLANSTYPSSQNTQVSNLLKQLASTNPVTRRQGGFSLMDLLSKDLPSNLNSKATPAIMSDLTIALTNCMPGVTFPAGVTDLSRAFQTNGIYVVRGLSGAPATEDPIFSRDGGYTALQAPASQTKPRDFYTWFGGTATVFAWPLADEFRTEDPRGQGYSYFVIRQATGPFTGEGLIAFCVGDFGNDKFRVQHEGTVRAPVDPAGIQGWADFNGGACPSLNAPLSSLLRSNGPLHLASQVLERGFELLAPAPLAAANRTGSGSGSGSFSDYGAVNADTVKLTFDPAPATGAVGSLNPQPVVKAVGRNGTPLEGVAITLSVTGNSGSFHFCGQKTVVTGQDGRAVFTGLVIDKAGGYTLRASSSYDEYVTSTVSTVFNLGGSPVPECT